MGTPKRLSLTLAAASVLTAALTSTSPASASAAQVTPSTPTGCQAHLLHGSNNKQGGDAWCTSGTGHVRVQIYCTANPQNGYGTFYFGPWLGAREANVSIAWCPTSQPYAVAAGYDLAAW
jgi:hypothetical protein